MNFNLTFSFYCRIIQKLKIIFLLLVFLFYIPIVFSQDKPKDKPTDKAQDKVKNKPKDQLPDKIEEENLKDEKSKKVEVSNPKDVERDLKTGHEKLIAKLPIDFGIFVDGYYNMNLNNPTATAQNYTTQAVQNNTFAINLAHIEAKLDGEKFRGRLAFQYGTSVNNNYSNETTNQKNSNQLSVRNIQEAFVGMKLWKKTWLDAGIYFGNIGFESWISGYNWVYTRALVLDNVPYYSTGLRLTHDVSDKFSIQLHLMNGWQNITDNNKDKALGMQLTYKFTDRMKLTYNNFIGNETSSPTTTDSTGMVYMPSKVYIQNYTQSYTPYTRHTRYYNNFIYHYDVTDRFGVAASFDVGYQIRGTKNVYNPMISDYNSNYPYYTAHSDKFQQWYDGTIWVTYKVEEKWRVSGRVERYVDKEDANVSIAKQSAIYQNQINLLNTVGVNTNSLLYPLKKQNGFQVSGASLCIDHTYNDYALLRTEFKYMKSMDPIFDYRNSVNLSRFEKMVIFAMTLKY